MDIELIQISDCYEIQKNYQDFDRKCTTGNEDHCDPFNCEDSCITVKEGDKYWELGPKLKSFILNLGSVKVDLCGNADNKTDKDIVMADEFDPCRLSTLRNTDNYIPSEINVFLPTLEDVLMWLGDDFESLRRIRQSTRLVGTTKGSVFHKSTGSNDDLKALIKAFMHVKYDKQWIDGFWTEGGQ